MKRYFALPTALVLVAISLMFGAPAMAASGNSAAMTSKAQAPDTVITSSTQGVHHAYYTNGTGAYDLTAKADNQLTAGFEFKSEMQSDIRRSDGYTQLAATGLYADINVKGVERK